MTKTMKIIEKIPTPEEYNHIRELVKWGAIPMPYVKTGLNNSTFGVCAYVNDEIVGLARVVGDGAIYFFIKDMIIHPDYQRQGIGTKIMNTIIKIFKERYENKGMVFLFAAKGKAAFYEKFGFEKRDDDAPGMRLINQ